MLTRFPVCTRVALIIFRRVVYELFHLEEYIFKASHSSYSFKVSGSFPQKNADATCILLDVSSKLSKENLATSSDQVKVVLKCISCLGPPPEPRLRKLFLYEELEGCTGSRAV